MIRRLRARHRRMIGVVAVVTLLVYALAVLGYTPPRRSPIPAALQQPTP